MSNRFFALTAIALVVTMPLWSGWSNSAIDWALTSPPRGCYAIESVKIPGVEWWVGPWCAEWRTIPKLGTATLEKYLDARSLKPLILMDSVLERIVAQNGDEVKG